MNDPARKAIRITEDQLKDWWRSTTIDLRKVLVNYPFSYKDLEEAGVKWSAALAHEPAQSIRNPTAPITCQEGLSVESS
jgi:hypothetical protein